MKTFKKRLALAVTVAALVALAGCTTMQDVKRSAESGNTAADSAAQALLDGRISKLGIPARGPVVTDVPFVDVTPVPVRERLPLAFSRMVTFNEPAGIPMNVLAARIQAVTGLVVSYQPELLSGASEGGGLSMGGSGPWSNLPVLPGASAGGSVSSADLKVAINYSGSARGLLDAVAASSKSSWEFDETRQRVNFFKFKTETFRISAVQGTTSSKAIMGGEGASSKSGDKLDTAKAEASHITEGSIWVGIEDGVKKLISSEGVYSISQSTGTILVRDVPDRMNLVRNFINDTNEAMSRQVDVEVTVYRVLTSDRDTRGLNWNLIFQNLIATSPYGIGVNSVRPDVIGQGLASAIISIKETDENGVPHRYGGSSMMIDALSKLGKASVVTNASVITANNQAAPVKVVRRTTYVAETTPTFMGGSGNTVSTGAALTPGSVETGLNLYVLPHVQDDGKRLRLKMMISLSTLESMETYGNGQASIQLPQVASREFQHEAWLNSGETLVLAGFEQVDSGLETSTPFDKGMWLAGGKRSAHKQKEMVVVALRPVVTAARSRI